MKRISIIAIALLVSAGCASLSQPIEIDQNFTPDETLKIRRAAEWWNGFSNEKLTLIFGAEVSGDVGGRNVMRRESSAYFSGSTAPGIIKIEVETIAITATEEGRPYLPYFERVVAHEFGHRLGLHHVADANALMAPISLLGRPLCLTADDSLMFKNAQGVDAPTSALCEAP